MACAQIDRAGDAGESGDITCAGETTDIGNMLSTLSLGADMGLNTISHVHGGTGDTGFGTQHVVLWCKRYWGHRT